MAPASRQSRQTPTKPTARAPHAAHKRRAQGAAVGARRRVVMQQWQRASMLLAVSLFTMLLSLPFGVLLLIGQAGINLGIPQRYAMLWLMLLVAGWFASLVLGLVTLLTGPSTRRRGRVFWLAALLVPASTVPSAAAFAYLRREELQDEVFADGPPPKRGWWSW